MNDSRTDATRRFRGPVSAALTWLLRIAIVINFTRFVLSFSPRFEGTAQKAGTIDSLLGSYTVLGFFRPDFAWLIVSSMILFPRLSISQELQRPIIEHVSMRFFV